MKRFKQSTETQTIIFPMDRYTAREARTWLDEHNKKAPKVERSKSFLRYRQKAPGYFDQDTFRTIPFGRTGIKAVIGVPKKKRSNPMEIIAINPRRKKRAEPKGRRVLSAKKPAKRRATPMSKKRKRAKRKAPSSRIRYRTKTKTVYRTRGKRRRRNPSRAYVKQTIAGINIGSAVKDALPLLLGALAGKAAAKKFAEGGAESDNWTWANYLWCIGGAAIASFGTQAIFKGKRGTAQKIFCGGLVLAAYKFFTNDVAPRNATLESWFGADAEEARLIESAAAAIDPYAGIFGDVNETPEGDFQMLGGPRLQPATARMGGYGQDVELATARMGGTTTEDFDAAYR